jgi:hypothetical protein
VEIVEDFHQPEKHCTDLFGMSKHPVWPVPEKSCHRRTECQRERNPLEGKNVSTIYTSEAE